MAGALPSTLHQKMKFLVGDYLVCLGGEEDLLVTMSPTTPYIDAAEEAVESSFRAFEVVNALYVGVGSQIPEPQVSAVALLVMKQTLGRGWKAGCGLGKNLNGILEPPAIIEKKDRYGLGYRPTEKDKERERQEKKEKRMAKLKGVEWESAPMSIPHLSQSFVSAGYVVPGEPKSEPALEIKFSGLSIHAIEDTEVSTPEGSAFVFETDVEPANLLFNSQLSFLLLKCNAVMKILYTLRPSVFWRTFYVCALMAV